MKKTKVTFKSLKNGINKNIDCWQPVKEKVKGLGIIERDTRVQIIDVDASNKTVLIKYMIGGFKKVSEIEFNQLKLFR
jgi:hypothetical protein